jgi:class 3 adenylate cyclase/tetratricopeptide (TPR) repeat protein
MRENEILERIIPYVPPYWVRQSFADAGHTLVAREGRIQSAMLFVDISGFTPISEALSRQGREGVEELSSILDRYFTVMSEPVIALGGEVIKFAGDSLIVAFPVQPDGGEAHLGAALSCAMRMQKAMSDLAQVHTSAGTFPLRIRIGMGEGVIYTTTVGDEDRGMQPVFAGRPLTRCMLAENMANAGEIVADAALANRVPGRLDIGEARGTFRLISGAWGMPVLSPIQQPDSLELGTDQAALLISRLAPYLPAQVMERIHQGQRGVYGEYRRVTIMFVRFSKLDYDSEPSIGRILQVHFTTMRNCILRHGGWLNEVDVTPSSGRFVVFFGAPIAHEDDELRAVSCAWEMQQAVADVSVALDGASHVRQCIGISSGPVFVGDVGAPVRRTYTAVGDEVNLASRLSDQAQWGEVVVTSWVRKRTMGRFDFEAMAAVRIKGKTELVPLFALIAPRQVSARDGLLPRLLDRRATVGRSAELSLLREVQGRVWHGESRLALITGEAGVGKSHLIGELARNWMEHGGWVLAADCHQTHNLPYGPWISLLREAVGLHESDSAERIREKLESELTLLSPSLVRQEAIFRQLVGEEAPDFILRLFSSEEWRVRFQGTFTGFFSALAHRQPLLIVFENLHDIDDVSLSLLGELLVQLGNLPLLVCAACRPGYDLGLTEHIDSITHLVLDTLPDGDSFTLVRGLLENVGLSFELASCIVEQGEGNPFYLKELVQTLVGVPDPAAACVQRTLLPESISDLMLAQLDPLGEDFALTMRIAAVVGPLFSFRVLQAAHPVHVTRHDLALRLARLERMHIVRLDHFGDDVRYCFRHAIIQRVVYASLLSSDRERFHRRVGQALQTVYAPDLEPWYELLAEHFFHGRSFRQAIVYAILAGRRAAKAHAVREALAHYNWVDELLSQCDTCLSRCLQGVRLELLQARGNVHYQLVEIPASIADYERAFKIASVLGDLHGQGQILLLLGNIALNQGSYPRAQTYARQAMQRFCALQDHRLAGQALLLLSQVYGSQGSFDHARQYVVQAIDLNGGVGAQDGIARCKGWLGAIQHLTGQRRLALNTIRRAIELGQRLNDPILASSSSLWLAIVLLYRGRWGQALELARQEVQVCRVSGTPLDEAEAKRVLAMVLIQIGAYEEAMEHLDEAMAVFADARWRAGLAYGYWLVGEAVLALGRHEQAAERFHQALNLGRELYAVETIVHAQLGLSKLAAVRQNWKEGERLCVEARARARQASLSSLVVGARLGLARTYLGQEDWPNAQREAAQALDASHQLGGVYDTVQAGVILGQALLRRDYVQRARDRFREAHKMVLQLEETLPEQYARVFADRAWVHALHEYASEEKGLYALLATG